MTLNSRNIALQVLCRVERDRAYINIILDAELQKFSGLDQRDKGLATELSYGVVRRQKTLDWYLDQICKKPMQKTNLCLRSILRLGAYQLLMLDRIPPSAAINESVKLAEQYSRQIKLPAKIAKGVVNGILRQLQRSRAVLKKPDILRRQSARLATEHSFPEWLVKRWIQRLGTEGAEDACRVNNQATPLSLRVNSLKSSVIALQEQLSGQVETLQPLPSPLSGLVITGAPPLAELSCLSNGEATVQNAASMLIPFILDPHPGERILDVCAGSGIKTTQIAERMRNQGRITAVDLYEGKLRRLKKNCERWGVDIVQIFCGDMTTVREVPGFVHEGRQGFDRILVDAPCSGLGVLRKHPEAKWTRQEDDMREFQHLQLKILSNASNFLPPEGGTLVYSTCTTEPEENEDLLARFLRTAQGFHVESIHKYIPEDLRPYITAENYLRIDPPQGYFDGFFCARLSSKKEEKFPS